MAALDAVEGVGVLVAGVRVPATIRYNSEAQGGAQSETSGCEVRGCAAGPVALDPHPSAAQPSCQSMQLSKLQRRVVLLGSTSLSHGRVLDLEIRNGGWGQGSRVKLVLAKGARRRAGAGGRGRGRAEGEQTPTTPTHPVLGPSLAHFEAHPAVLHAGSGGRLGKPAGQRGVCQPGNHGCGAGGPVASAAAQCLTPGFLV